ncbi:MULTISPECIES: LlaJI family restriction endonuclease [Vibrio]|uniref:LlaJI family restriction endonuclease n=1 Tax=Vibrio TaxID=662 RepID=UPI000CBC3D6C|nr:MULTISPECIES: LlaJI family restriction endonuclease [Vibrio]MBE8607996.1 LlaJI family restriction endonuclease [Vibrio sp. OPT10]PMH53485.1 hypothetical protein BCU65_18070 [Vibrio cyclitrophicus]
MQLSNILYLSDRTSLSDGSIPSLVLEELRKQGLIANDMQRVHFCGVLSYKDGIAVFLPRNYTALPKEKGSAAYYLLQALFKYYQDKDSGTYSYERGDEIIGGRSLTLAISLLEDYRKNGLYVRRVKEKTVQKGKVNWSRTISRSTAYPTENGPIYLDLHTSRLRYLTDCEISKIHAKVMRELFREYGMLWFGLSSYFDENLERMSKPSEGIDKNIAYLQRELNLSYSERDMFLIKSLIQYLEVKKGESSNNILIGTRKFHNLWESMLDECLVGKYSVNSKLPVPIYQTNEDKFIPVAQKGQRTDTVLRHEKKNKFAVIDAKYYDASSPATAPGWSDLVKQFYYQKALLELEGKDTPISNHFIFPGSVQNLKAAYVANRDVEVLSVDDCLPQYSAIHCHYQDPIQLLEAYVKGDKLTQLTREIFDLQ